MKNKLLVFSTLLSVSLCSSCSIDINLSSNSTDGESILPTEITSNTESASLDSTPTEIESSSDISSDILTESSSSEEIIDYDVVPTNIYTVDLGGVIEVYQAGQTFYINTWANYVVIDSLGRIVYTVANAGCGYGMPIDEFYYAHPLYKEQISSFVKDGYFEVPEGCTGYSMTYSAYGKLSNEISGGIIPENDFEQNGYGEHIQNWNSLNNKYFDMYSGMEFDGYMVDESFDFSKFGIGQPTVEQMGELPDYTPTTFSKSSYSTKTTSLGDGVDLVVATYKLNNGSTVQPHAVVVDLNKANIVAGTTNNSVNPANYYTKGTPYDHAIAYEKDNPGIKVLAATNADFFGTLPVHAFVKDGVILKDAHNSDATDVPVSKPMMFGVSSAGARIGTMTNLTNYADNQNAKLTDSGVSFAGKDGTNKGTFSVAYDSRPGDTTISIIATMNVSKSLSEGSKVYKFKKIQTDQTSEGEIRGCIVERETTTRVRVTDSRYGYLVLGPKCKDVTMEVGDYLVTNKSVYSNGGMWNYYDTIIGARHSLIENGVLPVTLAKEWQNGASARVPRTAVGIMSDGKVVIVSVEDVHYGGKASTCTGVTATELADFMRYFGCYDAANFDGGGSSQLVCREGYNGSGAFTVRTKSSDTNSTSPSSTRKVVNSVLVTTKN